ncbi:MAG: DNA polymerase III subunit beta, partial [Blastocatellia bacterium]
MKVRIEKQVLATELGLLQGIVERKSRIPILTNVHVAASDDHLALTATDLDVSLCCRCPAEVLSPGAELVNARKLTDVTRMLPESSVEIESVPAKSRSTSDDESVDSLAINCGASRFKLVCHPVNHFPGMRLASGELVSFPVDALGRSIARTIFATSQEESRYAMSGALFLVAGDAFQFVTTDGHLLAMASGGLTNGVGNDLRVVIPRKALAELQRLASATGEQHVTFSKDENHMFFDFGSRRFASRMLAGQFPTYESVIPQTCDKTLSVELDGVARAMRRAVLVADQKTHGVRFDFEKGRLTLTAENREVGESVEIVDIDYQEGASSLRVNASFLLDFLSASDSKRVSLDFKDGRTPVIVRPIDGTGQH